MGPAVLTGSVQKGPFVLGSSLQLSAINGSGAPTGQVFTTATTDDLGDFDVSFSYLGDVDIQAQGFYYDEVTGTLSAAPITLRALYDITNGGAQNAYINIITHLGHDRAISLMGGGMTLEAAEAQAEQELIAALAIGGTGFNPGGVGVSLNELGVDTDANAYLFAVSATLVQTVIQQHGTASLDANLQELLDTIASDLSAGAGSLPSTVTAPIRQAEKTLDTDLTMDLFAQRLASLGSMVTPADIDRAIDSDGDGYRNTIDSCPLVPNPMQGIIPTGVLCAATRHTSFLPAAGSAPSAAPIAGDFENTGHAAVLLEQMSGWSILLGDGKGRFAQPVSVTLPYGFIPTLAYDLDKDGNLDLVGASGWVAGSGNGKFSALKPFGPFTSGPVVADFNGDTIPDVAGAAGGGVAVLLAVSPGVFGSPIVSSAPFGPSWVFAFDVGAYANVIAVAESGSAAALFGNGEGGLNAGPVTSLGAALSGAAIGDFDGDGNVDVAGWTGGSVIVAFGDDDGALGSIATTAVSSANVSTGDYDADGKTDLWLGYDGACDPTTSVMLSRGRTFYSPLSLHATPTACGSAVAVLSPDLNGDGAPDVVVASLGAGGAAILQGYVSGEADPDYVCAGTLCSGACVDTSSNFFNCSKCGDQCAMGATCSAGVCQCKGMDAICGAECVNKASNLDNCGTCGNACTATGQTCVNGTCTCPGSSGIVCGGACVDGASDINNCGKCGNACGGGQICQSGMCACPGSEVLCNGICVDESLDINNCGSCGNACTATGQSCVSGTCTCPGSEVVCGGACVDESSDINNCGSCGNACTATGQSCVSGTCTCPGSEVVCGGACVDESSDINNCGQCGNVCGALGQSCVNGACRCPGMLGIPAVCNGRCVNLCYDDNNCGGCGIVCQGYFECKGYCSCVP